MFAPSAIADEGPVRAYLKAQPFGGYTREKRDEKVRLPADGNQRGGATRGPHCSDFWFVAKTDRRAEIRGRITDAKALPIR